MEITRDTDPATILKPWVRLGDFSTMANQVNRMVISKDVLTLFQRSNQDVNEAIKEGLNFLLKIKEEKWYLLWVEHLNFHIYHAMYLRIETVYLCFQDLGI